MNYKKMHPSDHVSSGLSSLVAYSSEESNSSDSDDESCLCEGSGPGNSTSAAKRARLDVSLTLLPQKESISTKRENVTENVTSKVSSSSSSSSLPLPGEILQMFSNRSDTRLDDPALHNGRTRSFPHVRGNWASYLYIPCQSHVPVINYLVVLIEDAKRHFEAQQTILLVDDMHVSVSRTQPFRHHWIDPFVSNLRKSISDVERVDLFFDEFHVYTNDEKTRTFISMKIITTEALLNLVEICNMCLADFQLEAYYKNPSFHISCAWMLEDQKTWAEENLIPFLNSKWKEMMDGGEADLNCHKAESLEFKTGNKLYRFPFSQK